MGWSEPSLDNHFLSHHIDIVRTSYNHWMDRDLAPSNVSGSDIARWFYHAPFVLLSHDTQPDPLFNYANLSAQNLFEMDWATFVTTPSRLSAEPAVLDDRQKLLEEVAANGFIKNYRGIRMTASGKRFWIEEAVVWNLFDRDGQYYGQAALFERWRWVD